jgi:RNA ligase (TIGR02306 family)
LSDHTVEVVRVRLEEHPNAERLSIVKVHSYQCVVRTQDWKDGDLAAYIPPDSVVPDKEEYKFLDGHLRIKARRFRGVWSFGLLMPAPRGSKPGDNVADVMGVTHYEPPMQGSGMTEHAADFAKAPTSPGPVYDVDNILRYDQELTPDVEVVITEKLHGANIRMTYQNGKFHVASRRFWRREFDRPTARNLIERGRLWILERLGRNLDIPTTSEYWKAFKAQPDLMEIVKRFGGLVFYGELYGRVQSGFTYDSNEGNKIRIFDVLDPTTRTYLPWPEVANIVPSELLVPVDYIGPFEMNVVQEYAEHKSQLTGDHVREGVVVKPLVDMWSDRLGGRIILKYINPVYLERS